MLIALLITLQVVQASDFASFKVCYLDTSSSPWEFRPHPEGHTFNVRKSQIVYVDTPAFETAGIDCTRACSAYGCKFVIGTIASVMEAIRGESNASD